MLALRPLAAALVLLALVHGSAAQAADKQAVAQVKAATKSQLKTFKQSGAAALADLNDALGALEGQLDASSTPASLASSVDVAAGLFAAAVESAFLDATTGVDFATQQALTTLAGGGDLAGEYPKDLYYSQGTVLDGFRIALDKAAAKLRDAALMRLAKTAAKAEKVSGLALELELRLPSMEESDAVDQSTVLGVGQSARLDVVVAASKLDTPGDVAIEVSGLTELLADEVTVGIFTSAGETSSPPSTPGLDGHFTTGFLGADEGGCVAFVKQGGLFSSTVAIGMR